MPYGPHGIAHRIDGVSVMGKPRHAPAERDLDADLVAPLAALRHLDGDEAAALVLPLPDEQRARIAAAMVRRPALFPGGAVRAVLASTPKGTLGRVMGPHAAAVAWRQHVGP